MKKYGDDEGGRQAALITYYGFLSVFPLLLLGVAVLSRVLADHPDLRQRLITAIVPQGAAVHGPALAGHLADIDDSAGGLIGLLFSGTGVVFSAYQTLNHVAAVRHRCRAGFLSRYVRVFAVLAALMAGAPLLARLVAKAGPVYGSFATVAGIFAPLYLVGQALVYAAEVAAVRYARLWPRALDLNHPTAADARAGPAGPRAGTHPCRPHPVPPRSAGLRAGTAWFPASQRWPRLTRRRPGQGARRRTSTRQCGPAAPARWAVSLA